MAKLNDQHDEQGRQLIAFASVNRLFSSFEFSTSVRTPYVGSSVYLSVCAAAVSSACPFRMIDNGSAGQFWDMQAEGWGDHGNTSHPLKRLCWLAKRWSLSFTDAIPCLAACILSVLCVWLRKLRGCVGHVGQSPLSLVGTL